ncbi:translation initiation factor IF-2 [Lutispora thermophila]|uniref:Translation initiation factor IF-2 n=1 Tax=Lutispora thermophila DSM 19022 TaxID=1122184 RepID=A0A1M6I514_9FIRM|nr:translation initiation factor IF-2 [Lutispora thermophila]SHJ29502.1 translation initiation factor IF-2 [Lutispora thermophila DSM 19022]
MSKKRLYELAKELGVSSKELINKAKEANININNHMSNIESHEEKAIRDLFTNNEKRAENKTENKEKVNIDYRRRNNQNSTESLKPKESVRDAIKDVINEDFESEFRSKKLTKKNKKIVSNKKNEDNAKKTYNKNDKKKGKQINVQVNKDENIQANVPKKPIKIGSTITVKDFSEKTGKTVAEIIKKLLLLGVVATINQELDFDTAALIADEFGIKIERAIDKDDEELLLNDVEDKEEDLKPRPPVVTIMGHVDHGKTSLLDAIRQTNVIATEAGGITQHIGAYMVNVEGRKIAFLDTPGHEAFTAMRARGAKVTDIAVLVVAADDGVMPQTIEAINHAKAANVTIIVAINKIDKAGANPDRVKQELTEHGLLPEDWGGDTICVPVSAKKKIGIENLLEMILLVAEMQELKANPNRKAKGTVIEAKLDKNRGPVATVLIQNGTLNAGDFFVVGNTHGKVRTMTDEKGKNLKKAGPSTPVEITGLAEVPDAGDILIVVDDEKVAKQISDKRKEKYRQEHLQSGQKISLDDLFSQIQSGKVKELNLIVKADVQGSVEAVKQSLEKLSNDEVKIKAIHGGVGAITETDVTFASASNAIIIGFNVRPQASAMTLAEKEKVDIRLYRVIYDAIEDIQSAMKGMLEPEYKEVVLGHAEVRAIFKASSIGTIAGSYVTDGKVNRNNDVRVIRDGVVIYEGKISSLKRFKDDVKEVNTGFECGISLEKFNDIKEGDIIECFTMEAIPRK